MKKESIISLLDFCKDHIFCYLGIKDPLDLEKGWGKATLPFQSLGGSKNSGKSGK